MNDGDTPMLVASYGGHQSTVKWLEGVGAVLDEAALEAAKKGLARMALGGEAEADMRERFEIKDGRQARLVRQLERHCPECDKVPAVKRCGGCKAAYYCSRKCQTAQWDTHKKECAGLRHKGQAAGCSK